MKVNCVIVTYNRLALLKECLAAIEKQTYPIHKVIVIDNCSTDGTKEYLKAYACLLYTSGTLTDNHRIHGIPETVIDFGKAFRHLALCNEGLDNPKAS